MHADADVIVVGAGVAGLAAAAELCRHGLKVCIVEARDRIGGRIFTKHDAHCPVPIELGAEFIHGKPPNLWKIIDAAGIASIDLPDNHFYSRKGSLKQPNVLWDQIDLITASMRKERDDLPLAQFLERKYRAVRWNDAKTMLRSYVEGFHAARTERIGISALIHSDDASDAIEGGKQFRILAGYDSVVQWLRTQIDDRHTEVRLNTVVKQVDWKPGSVTVSTLVGKDRTARKRVAKRLLITLPLGVLKAPRRAVCAVTFHPELPEKETAIRKLEMGSVVRMVLQFKTRFWESRHFSPHLAGTDVQFIHAPDELVRTFWTALPVRVPLLTAWVGGPSAEKLALKGERFILRSAIDTLAHVLKVERKIVQAQLERCYFHNWHTDVFTRGAYSYVPAGASEFPALLARPVAGTLFFAGEATDCTGNTGTVHGAIGTGQRAAAEIIKSL